MKNRKQLNTSAIKTQIEQMKSELHRLECHESHAAKRVKRATKMHLRFISTKCPVPNKPFSHLSKSAYRYSWFTCKQTIVRSVEK